MAKLLLVEDDNNLREIYEARLSAEGYDIVTAQNGEDALVVAKQNHPDLIISDVMMPRISGFEMLDILRNTDELRDTKVIMLTALGQAEDQSRAGKLGADKYLVKSQVTLEDIVNAAQELLASTTVAPAAAAADAAQQTEQATPAASAVPAAATATDVEPSQSPAVPPPAAPEPTPSPIPSPTPLPDDAVQAVAAAPVVAVPDPDPIVTSGIDPSGPAPAVDPAIQPSAVAVVPPEPVAAIPPVEPPLAAATAPAEPAITPSPPVTVDPSTPVESPAPLDTTAQSNDETLARAVEQLTAPASEPAAVDAEVAMPTEVSSSPPTAVIPPAQQPASVTAAVMVEAPEPAVNAAPVVDSPAPVEQASDHVTVAGKKIIQPLSGATAAPDIQELLAKEEAKEEAAASPGPIVVNGAPASQAPGLDPNSIAL